MSIGEFKIRSIRLLHSVCWIYGNWFFGTNNQRHSLKFAELLKELLAAMRTTLVLSNSFYWTVYTVHRTYFFVRFSNDVCQTIYFRTNCSQGELFALTNVDNKKLKTASKQNENKRRTKHKKGIPLRTVIKPNWIRLLCVEAFQFSRCACNFVTCNGVFLLFFSCSVRYHM